MVINHILHTRTTKPRNAKSCSQIELRFRPMSSLPAGPSYVYSTQSPGNSEKSAGLRM